jgi:hypothetical protein
VLSRVQWPGRLDDQVRAVAVEGGRLLQELLVGGAELVQDDFERAGQVVVLVGATRLDSGRGRWRGPAAGVQSGLANASRRSTVPGR